MICNDRTGIDGLQLVFPGGKSKTLSKQDAKELASLKLYDGRKYQIFALSIEQTNWWAEKSKFNLCQTLLPKINVAKIFIVDHLGKHRDLCWVKKLAQNGYAYCLGACGQTAVTQMNDMNCNGYYDLGIKHCNAEWAANNPLTDVPSIAKCAEWQMNITNAINGTPSCIAQICSDYDIAGYAQPFDGSKVNEFLSNVLKTLNRKNNKSLLSQLLPTQVIEQTINVDTCDFYVIFSLKHKSSYKSTATGKRTLKMNRAEMDDEIYNFYQQQRKLDNNCISRDELNEWLRALFKTSDRLKNELYEKYKWNEWSDEGKLAHLEEIVLKTTDYVVDHVQQQQKQRQSDLEKKYIQINMIQNEDDGKDDLDEYIVSLQKKYEYTKKKLESNGNYSFKNKGTFKINRKSRNITNQPRISDAFKRVETLNAQNQQNIQKVMDDHIMLRGGSNHRNHNQKVRSPPNKKQKMSQSKIFNFFKTK